MINRGSACCFLQTAFLRQGNWFWFRHVLHPGSAGRTNGTLPDCHLAVGRRGWAASLATLHSFGNTAYVRTLWIRIGVELEVATP